MSAIRTYLDHNATSPMRPEVREVMIEAMSATGNPSSVHTEGRYARGLIDDAREKLARLVNANPDEVIFTSGGTEANNMVLHQSWGSVIVTATEHDSIITTARAGRPQYAVIPVDASGRADLTVLERLMTALISHDGPMLISIQMANNETGVLQDMTAIRALITRFIEDNQPRDENGAPKEIIFHTDAVQALAKIPVDFDALGLDAMSISAHKIAGPKGVGALVKRNSLSLKPLIKGGGQEYNNRAGTENVAAIAGFGKAAELAISDLTRGQNISRLRDRLEKDLGNIAPEAKIIAAEAARLPNTSTIAFPGLSAETQIIAFDLAGIALSAGAACSSGKVGRSRVLEAMQIKDELADATIRISLGWNSTDEDVDNFLAVVPRVIGVPHVIETRQQATKAA